MKEKEKQQMETKKIKQKGPKSDNWKVLNIRTYMAVEWKSRLDNYYLKLNDGNNT